MRVSSTLQAGMCVLARGGALVAEAPIKTAVGLINFWRGKSSDPREEGGFWMRRRLEREHIELLNDQPHCITHKE